MYICRGKDSNILRFINSVGEHKNVLLVEGARQVGKTALTQHAIRRSGKCSCAANLEKDTLLRSLIDECESFEMFTRLLRNRLDFDPDSGSVMFIDEAQKSMVLGRFVRFMKEDWPRATVILSGSTLRRLFRKDVRYPVGRVTTLVLSPFSFSEYLTGVGKSALARDVLAQLRRDRQPGPEVGPRTVRWRHHHQFAGLPRRTPGFTGTAGHLRQV